MWIIYLAGIKIYGALIWILSLFHDKAQKWVAGRRGLFKRVADEVDRDKRSIWFHFASLGEFEQGRSVLEGMRTHRPDKTIVVTFYSPSGYEIRKNTPLADYVYYLPEDTPGNARTFIQLINPELAVFTKYEYWPFYFRTLASNGVPLYLISGIFRPDQIFFKWYGGFFRKTLRCVTHFFTQNEESLVLLANLGITNATLAGDTRFDRVVELPKTRKPIREIESLVAGRLVLVAGSTWPADEELLAHLHEQHPDWALIIAPHEIHEAHISAIEKLFPRSVRFSSIRHQISDIRHQTSDNRQQITGHRPPTTNHQPPVLIIDNIGMLSSLYAYGLIAYIGGGFGAGIHNTLEAATYGIPIIFGPNYHKFQEAKDLIALESAFAVQDKAQLLTVFENLQNNLIREKAGKLAEQYVRKKSGATALVLGHLKT